MYVMDYVELFQEQTSVREKTEDFIFKLVQKTVRQIALRLHIHICTSNIFGEFINACKNYFSCVRTNILSEMTLSLPLHVFGSFLDRADYFTRIQLPQ